MVNQDQFEGQWKQLKGGLREQFAKLTEDDVEQVAGKRDRLLGKLQERYGDSRDEAEKKLSEYEAKLSRHTP